MEAGAGASGRAIWRSRESPRARVARSMRMLGAMKRERLGLATFVIVCCLVIGCGASTGSTPDGGRGGDGGARDGSGDSSIDASHVPGFCNTADDCVYKLAQPCCGSCVGTNDPPLPASRCPTGAACVAPPGGCSCVDHQCLDGTLTGGDSCDPQHDMCGLGYKCCQSCGVAPIDGGQSCPAMCVLSMFSSTTGQYLCPLVP